MFAARKQSLGYILYLVGFSILIFRITKSCSAEFLAISPRETCQDWYIMYDKQNFVRKCYLNNDTTKIKCTGTVNTSDLESQHKLKFIKDVYLCGWQDQKFDPIIMINSFHGVKYIEISYGSLAEIVNYFPDSPFLEVINISYTHLSTVNVNLVKHVRNLKILDLRFNKLKYMEAPLILPKKFQQLFLSDNNWNCSQSLSWVLDLEKTSTLVDTNILACSDPKFQGRNLATVAYYKRVSEVECLSHLELRNCSCLVHYIIKSEDGKSLTPIYAINCSSLNLYNLPSYIPQNTTIVYATNNKISDVSPLRDNDLYRNVIDVYLDNNNINSIDVLEAGYWLRHFRVFSLRNNQIQKLPVYAIDDILENNLNAVKLQLSQNPWACDCKFVMRFREILMKYHTIIKDSWNVTCNVTTLDDQVVETAILSIQRIDVCKLPANNSNFILDLMNCVLATLILFLILKVGYDYYYYKNYGQLPWIITQIP